MKGVIVNFEDKEIVVVQIPKEIVGTGNWEEATEEIDDFLCQKAGCLTEEDWHLRYSFFVLEDGEPLRIFNR